MRVSFVVLLAGLLFGMLAPKIFASDGKQLGQGPKFHMVLGGESLWSIGRKVTPSTDTRRFVYEVMKVNGMRSPSVVPGQKIKLP